MTKSYRHSASAIIVIATVLLMLVVARTVESVLSPVTPSPDITTIATILLKDKNPALYGNDFLFYSTELYAGYIPLYRWLLDQLWQLSGSFEQALMWLVPILTTTFLVGTYLLLWRVTRNSWISLGLTVASATVHPTLGDDYWGMSDTTTMGARSFFMAATPYLALLYFSMLQQPRWYKGLAFGLLVGFFAAFHPISGFHFLVVMLAWSLFTVEKTAHGWQAIIAIVPGAILSGWPVAWNVAGIVNKTVGDDLTFEIFSRIVRERREMPFFPATLDWTLFNLRLDRPGLDVLVWLYVVVVILLVMVYGYSRRQQSNAGNWVWLIGGLVTVFYAYMAAQFKTPFMFAVIAVYLVYRCLSGRLAQLDKWLVILLGLIILYAFVGYYFVTFIWQQLELWSFTAIQLEFNRSARFIYLPTYLLVALAGVELVKKLAGHPFLGSFGTETTYSIITGIVFALADGAGQPFDHSFIMTILVTAATVAIVTALVFALKRLLPASILPYAALFLFFLLLFGPPADVLADYTPVPARNLFRPTNWLQQPVYVPTDTELYSWVVENTPADVLFWVCDLSSAEQTRFRFKTQRSISHNWKDLPFHIRYRASLLPAYERYHMLESACDMNYTELVATAATIKADYLLITPSVATHYLAQACFSNTEYAVFTLDPNGCPQH